MSERTQKLLFYVLFTALYFATNQPYVYAEVGIDPSWWTSLIMAIDNGAVFGREFIFNYGPLGYLNTLLLPSQVSPWLIFVFHSFLLVNFLFISKLAFEKLGDQWKWGALVALMILLPWGFIADATFTLFYLLLFWLLYMKTTRNAIPLFIGLLITVLIFYIKVNLSLIATTVFIGSLLYFNVSKVLSWRSTFVLLVSLAVLIWVFSVGLHVDIPAYLSSSLEIIDAYQDAMTVKLIDGAELWTLLGFIALALGLVLILIAVNLAYFWENIFLYLLVSIGFFLGFKQAFTATGHYNIFGFFLLLPPLSVLLYLFLNHQLKGWPRRLVFAILLIQLIATQFIRLSYMNYNVKTYALFAFPDKVVGAYNANPKLYQLLKVFKYKNPINYFSSLVTYEFEENFERQDVLDAVDLPDDIVQKIGEASFDVVPWETSYAFFNKLNYQNRPVIQSYQANSQWLAGKNEELYFSDKAPEYVLSKVVSFREQNPYWVDQGVYKALRYDYSLVDTVIVKSDTNFLFQKKAMRVKSSEKHFLKKEGKLNTEISVPSDSVDLYLYADVDYNWKGKIARLFFQPPYLWCTVTYRNGKTEDFRTPPPILKGGVYMRSRVVEMQDFSRISRGKEDENLQISSVKFWSESSWGFEQNFDFHYSQIKR